MEAKRLMQKHYHHRVIDEQDLYSQSSRFERIFPKLPKFSCRYGWEKAFQDNNLRQSLKDCDTARWPKIGQFEMHKPFHETVSKVSVQFRERWLSRSRKIDDYSFITFHRKLLINGFQNTVRKNHFGIYRAIEADSIDSTSRKVH
jgi:hypothetical protein